MQLPSILEGESLKRLLQGAAAGAAERIGSSTSPRCSSAGPGAGAPRTTAGTNQKCASPGRAACATHAARSVAGAASAASAAYRSLGAKRCRSACATIAATS